MDIKDFIVFDIETNALVNSTKIHCLSFAEFRENDWKIETLFDYDVMRSFLEDPDKTLVGHNILDFDVPELERLLGIKISCRLLDTLPLVWKCFPNRLKEGKKYGLDSFGEDTGILKPKIDNWEDIPREVYQHRCEEDVRNNKKD